jgi:hypothetical protein
MKQYWLIILLFAGIAARAQDSLKVMLGKTLSYSAIVSKGDEMATCTISGKAMRTAFSSVTVYFVLKQQHTVYKNTLQLVYNSTDGTEKTIDKPLTRGKAVFPGANFKKLLRTHKQLKLRLVQSPANPQMSIATRIRDLLFINTK